MTLHDVAQRRTVSTPNETERRVTSSSPSSRARAETAIKGRAVRARPKTDDARKVWEWESGNRLVTISYRHTCFTQV